MQRFSRYEPGGEEPCTSKELANLYISDGQIRAEEARSMDPQHRHILECAFEAAEQAGVRLSDLAGSNVGAFAANEKSE